MDAIQKIVTDSLKQIAEGHILIPTAITYTNISNWIAKAVKVGLSRNQTQEALKLAIEDGSGTDEKGIRDLATLLDEFYGGEVE